MNDVRAVFLDASAAAVDLLAHDAVATRWAEPSALPGLTVGGLASHLGRATRLVVDYLSAGTPNGAPIGVVAYYLQFDDLDDPGSDLNRKVAARSEAGAADGPARNQHEARQAHESLVAALETEPDDRLVTVAGPSVMLLDDYLVTRVVELVVHSDDLAQSVGLDTPPTAPEVGALVVATLAELSRQRHGDLRVIRAFARAERAGEGSIRAF